MGSNSGMDGDGAQVQIQTGAWNTESPYSRHNAYKYI